MDDPDPSMFPKHATYALTISLPSVFIGIIIVFEREKRKKENKK